MTSEFRSWDWNFGKTPKFTVSQKLEVKSSILSRINAEYFDDSKNILHHLVHPNLYVEVQNGIVKEVKIILPDELALTDFNQDASVITNFCGARYNHEIIEDIIAAISCKTIMLRTLLKSKDSVIIT